MRQHRQRKEKRLGCMQVERALETQPSFERLLKKFGIVNHDEKMPKHAAWSTFSRVARDAEVVRVREALKIQQRGGLFSEVGEVETTLTHFSAEALLRLRYRVLFS
jgi:hypothetical protein